VAPIAASLHHVHVGLDDGIAPGSCRVDDIRNHRKRRIERRGPKAVRTDLTGSHDIPQYGSYRLTQSRHRYRQWAEEQISHE
jgi:hypothetical protein